MMPTPLITLTSDLGEKEPFVAGIKGVLYSQCPGVHIVDLSHELSPYNVIDGVLFAAGAFPYFPAGVIHLIAIAPGPEPRAVAVQINEQIVVCPDNGILTVLAQRHKIETARLIEIEASESDPLQHIFFARDILAGEAAKLARGVPIEKLGPPIESLKQIDWPMPTYREKNRLEGIIMHVDRFGNLVTNIHLSDLDGVVVDRVQAGEFVVYHVSNNYYDVPEKKPLAIFGHSGYLELAYNSDRACDRLDLGVGIFVSVYVKK